MLFHGGDVDPTVWIYASSIQHHPEAWPRTADDGPITSWNRSLGFFLANHGYDVFLVGTRGTYGSRGHTRFRFKEHEDDGSNEHAKVMKNVTLGPGMPEIMEYDLTGPTMAAYKYWDYCFDDLVEYEVPRQIERVLEITGASKVTVVVQSYSTIWSMALFSSDPSVSAKVHQYVSTVPLYNQLDSNNLIKALHTIVAMIPNEVGNLITQGLIFTQPVRELFVKLNRLRRFRYIIAKSFISLIFGPSAKYTLFLEDPVIGHMLQPVGFKQVKHWSQITMDARLQKYDYGREGNMVAYNSTRPPKYSLANFMVKNWILLSGDLDTLGSKASVAQILDEVAFKPYKHIAIPHYMHFDLVAGFTNGPVANMPVLEFLDEFQLPPVYYEEAYNEF